MNKEQHWSKIARAAAEKAADRAGVSLEGLVIRYGNIGPATWGDKVGLIVSGGDTETRERVTSYLIKWLSKNLRKILANSYNQQVHVDQCAKPLHEGELAIGCVYYPCE